MIGHWNNAVANRNRKRRSRQRAHLLAQIAGPPDEAPATNPLDHRTLTASPPSPSGDNGALPPERSESGDLSFDDLSKRQIMIRLDRAGVDYDSRASKTRLAALLAEADHGDGN